MILARLAFALRRDGPHWRIARGMLLVGGFVLVGKLAGAGREMIIAWRYGVSPTVDAYVLVMTIVMLLPTLWASVSMSVLVPLVRRLERERRGAFDAELTGAVLLAAGVVTLLALWLLPPALELLPGFAGEIDRHLVRGLAPLAGGGLVVGLLAAQLLANEQHGNTLLEGVPALTVMLALLAWPGGPTVDPLIYGTLFGVVLQIAGLWYLLRRSGHAVLPRLAFDSPAWNGLRVALGLMVVGKLVTLFVAPIDQLIAGSLGEGSIAVLNYAYKLLALVIGLGGTAIGRAILPVLSRSRDKDAESLALARRWSALLFGVGLVACVATILLAEQIVALLFERGAFTAENTREVARTVRFGAVQLPFFFASIVLVQLFASRGRYTVLLTTSVMTLVVKVVCSLALAGPLGVGGIALGTGIMYATNCAYLVYASRTLEPGR